jgi:hypothetical protein
VIGFTPSPLVLPVTNIPPPFILTFILIMFLSEGKAGEAYEPSNKAVFLRFNRKIHHVFRVFSAFDEGQAEKASEL